MEQATPKKKRPCLRSVGRTWIRRIIRRALVYLDGCDYRDRYAKLAAHHALSDIVGRSGYFRARGRKFSCTITGVVVRMTGGDYLIIDYVCEDGMLIRGAQIPRSSFRLVSSEALSKNRKEAE